MTEVGECEESLLAKNQFLMQYYLISHVEGHSTVLGTALNYCAMRLLGVSADHPALIKARTTLHRLGSFSLVGPVKIPH